MNIGDTVTCFKSEPFQKSQYLVLVFVYMFSETKELTFEFFILWRMRDGRVVSCSLYNAHYHKGYGLHMMNSFADLSSHSFGHCPVKRKNR